jgi:hypothetical protein
MVLPLRAGPLRAGPLFSKICKSASAGLLIRYHYFFCSALAALTQVRYSANAVFSTVHTFIIVFSFSNKLSTSSKQICQFWKVNFLNHGRVRPSYGAKAIAVFQIPELMKFW